MTVAEKLGDRLWFDKETTAEILQLSVRTLERSMKAGDIPYKKFGSSVRFPRWYLEGRDEPSAVSPLEPPAKAPEAPVAPRPVEEEAATLAAALVVALRQVRAAS
jgi:hypothetical protein